MKKTMNLMMVLLFGLVVAGGFTLSDTAWGKDMLKPDKCQDGILGNSTHPPGPKEQCEDYNSNDNDDCTSGCQIASCGDGILHDETTDPDQIPTPQFDKPPPPLEGCDDGNTAFGDGCSAICFVEALCGNGTVDPGELCDPADATTGPNCTTVCTLDSKCGDGTVDADNGEQCDDGDDDDTDSCDSNCISSKCGDGLVNGTEECDDANTNNFDACGNDCIISICGDGEVDIDIGETCDDGNMTNSDGCDDDVSMSGSCDNAPSGACGDGTLDPGEQCDDSNTTDGDNCSSTCLWEYCGNSLVEDADLALDTEQPDSNTGTSSGSEGDVGTDECDDGNLSLTDGCDTARPVSSSGTLGTYMMDDRCDDRENCGDGILDTAAGEECDDGNTSDGDGCSAGCLLETEFCGDGILQPFEQCDDGNTNQHDACKNDCTVNDAATAAGIVCGDGVIQPPELCDDGNNEDGDGCSNACQLEGDGAAECGDGVISALECDTEVSALTLSALTLEGSCPEDCLGAADGADDGADDGGGDASADEGDGGCTLAPLAASGSPLGLAVLASVFGVLGTGTVISRRRNRK